LRCGEYAAPVTAGQPGTLSNLLCQFGTSGLARLIREHL
jgi:hypothetical protein